MNGTRIQSALPEYSPNTRESKAAPRTTTSPGPSTTASRASSGLLSLVALGARGRQSPRGDSRPSSLHGALAGKSRGPPNSAARSSRIRLTEAWVTDVSNLWITSSARPDGFFDTAATAVRNRRKRVQKNRSVNYYVGTTCGPCQRTVSISAPEGHSPRPSRSASEPLDPVQNLWMIWRQTEVVP